MKPQTQRRSPFAAIALIVALAALAGVGALWWQGRPHAKIAKTPAPAPAITAKTTPAEQTIKVVYHADFADPRRFSAMLTSINNMVSMYQTDMVDYDVRIVFVSYGIRFVTKNPLKGTPFAEDAALRARRKELLDRLESLREAQGVKLELCNITREQVKLPADQLIEGVRLVPSGVVRIAELEHRGFAYIKIE